MFIICFFLFWLNSLDLTLIGLTVLYIIFIYPLHRVNLEWQ